LFPVLVENAGSRLSLLLAMYHYHQTDYPY